MAKTYLVSIEAAMVYGEPATLYRVISPHDSNAFSQPIRADHILRGVEAQLSEDHKGGVLALVHGSPSLPVAIALAIHLARRFRVMAVYNKECDGYVVAASEHPSYRVGDIFLESEVST